jgi:HrpA-like RNA helicase
LHSELSISERQNVVASPRFGVTKIIVATNIAEESITIPYINTVIDLGKEKSMKHNKFGIAELRSEDIAKANSKKRAGRAGRTQN